LQRVSSSSSTFFCQIGAGGAGEKHAAVSLVRSNYKKNDKISVDAFSQSRRSHKRSCRKRSANANAKRECDQPSRANRRGVVLAVTRNAASFSLLRLGALNQLKVPLIFTVNRGTGDTLYFGRAT
jgi:hypothetical protein